MSVRCLEKLARAGGRALFLVNSMAVCVTALLPPPAYYSNPYIVFAFCVQLPTSLPLSPSQRPINSAWKVRFRGCWTLWLIAGQFVSLRPWTDIGRQWQRGSPLSTESPLVTPRGLRWATKGLLRTVALAENCEVGGAGGMTTWLASNVAFVFWTVKAGAQRSRSCVYLLEGLRRYGWQVERMGSQCAMGWLGVHILLSNDTTRPHAVTSHI